MSTTVTEQIEQAIGEHHGSVYEALNMTLADLDVANALLEAQKEKSIALVEVLATIRELIWADGQPPITDVEKTIDKIACKALADLTT